MLGSLFESLKSSNKNLANKDFNLFLTKSTTKPNKNSVLLQNLGKRKCLINKQRSKINKKVDFLEQYTSRKKFKTQKYIS